MERRVLEKLAARNGQDTLRANLEDGRSVYLHSSYNPEQEALSWCNEISYKSGNIIVLFGLGLGYHLKALVAELGTDLQVFVIEPCDEAAELAKSDDELYALLSRPGFIVCKDWNSFKQAFSSTGFHWQDTLFLKNPAYQQAFRDEYQQFLTKLHNQIGSALVDLCTIVTSSQRWQENCLRNLRFLPESAPVSSVFDQFQGRPLIVVSAGPSLSKNIDLLTQAKGKAFILAVGTVNRLLSARGILPDLVASFDGMKGNFNHHFQGVQSENLCLLYDPAVHHMVVSEHSGPKTLMLINPVNSWIEKHARKSIGQLRMGPSIANTVFDLACRMGADPIIFVGQDLAFTDDATHAEGTHVEGLRGFRYTKSDPEEKSSESKRDLRKLVWVEGIDGEKVQTDSKMLTYLHWFEERIEELEGTRKVVDATEGGALIKGTLPLTLAEALDGYCQEDISEDINKVMLLLTTKPDYDIEGVADYLRTVRNSAKRLATACKKGAHFSKLLEEHHKRGKKIDLPSTLNRLKKVDQMLVTEEPNYRPLHYLTGPILGLLSNMARKAGNQAEASHYSYLLYLELYRAFSRSLPLLKELIDSLDSYQDCHQGMIGIQPALDARLGQL